MKKPVYLLFVLFILFTLPSCTPQNYLPPFGAWESADPVIDLRSVPQLSVSIQSEVPQRVGAIGGVSNWTYTDAYGVTHSGPLTDSPHSLQHSQADLSRVTLYLYDEINEIKLEFGAPPQSVTVTRWNAAYVGTLYISEAVDENVPVGLNGNTISIINDGYAYIYEVHAIWEQGLSYFTFRTEPAR